MTLKSETTGKVADAVKAAAEAAKAAKEAKTATSAAKAGVAEGERKGFWKTLREEVQFSGANTVGSAFGEFLSNFFSKFIHPAPTQLVNDILNLPEDCQEKLINRLEASVKKGSYPSLIKALCKTTEGIEDETKRREVLEKLIRLEPEAKFDAVINIVEKTPIERLISGDCEALKKLGINLWNGIRRISQSLEQDAETDGTDFGKIVLPPLRRTAAQMAERTGSRKNGFGRFLNEARRFTQQQGK